MPTLNYSTKVPVSQTLREIQDALARQGATRIATDYAEGRPKGLSFMLPTVTGVRVFHLPVDVPAVRALLVRQHAKSTRVDARPEQAERVAWRVMREWLLAQLAIVEAQMVSIDQVMLPFMAWNDDQTLYDAFRDRALAELEEGPA